MRRTRPRREPTARELALLSILWDAVCSGRPWQAEGRIPSDLNLEAVRFAYAPLRRQLLRELRRSSYRKPEGP